MWEWFLDFGDGVVEEVECDLVAVGAIPWLLVPSWHGCYCYNFQVLEAL